MVGRWYVNGLDLGNSGRVPSSKQVGMGWFVVSHVGPCLFWARVVFHFLSYPGLLCKAGYILIVQ